MLMIALLVFFIFSIACALAQTMTQLIIFRALQGVGGGAIMTVAIIMYLSSFLPIVDLIDVPSAPMMLSPCESDLNTKASLRPYLSFRTAVGPSLVVHYRNIPPGAGHSGSTCPLLHLLWLLPTSSYRSNPFMETGG